MNKYIEEYKNMSLCDFADELDEPLFTIKQNLTQAIYFHYAKERDENFKLQQKNKTLQERIEYLERSNNRREETIELERKENLELHNKIDKLEDELNWYKQECDDLEMSGGVGE